MINNLNNKSVHLEITINLFVKDFSTLTMTDGIFLNRDRIELSVKANSYFKCNTKLTGISGFEPKTS